MDNTNPRTQADVFPPPLTLDGGEDAIPSILQGSVGRSRALHTSWLWVKNLGVLFDAGEGCSLELGPFVGSPARVFITHGHSDHVLGLPALIAARQFPSLVSGGPIEIFYPAGCRSIAALRQFMGGMWPAAEFDRVSWYELFPGDRVPLSSTRSVVAFRTEHSPHHPSLGYAVVESRTRLPAGLAGLSGQEIAAIVKERGRNAVEEAFEHTLLLHTGDSVARSYEQLRNADVAIVDATFLAESDRDANTHASADEVVRIANEMGVKDLVLHHLSLRYDRDFARARLRDIAQSSQARLFLWDERRINAI